MKKALLIAASTAITATAMLSCGSTQPKQQQTENPQTDNNQTNNNKIMKPIELTKADFLTRVSNFETNPTEWNYLGDRPAIIDFYASWCGPCKTIAPILEELAEEYGDQIVIYKVDTEREQELAAVFGIRSIPSLLFVPMEGKPQMAMGAMPKSAFREAIDGVLLNK
ncbi:MAG: thioredoxin [Alistipes sp.]|jgi:thioredoxin|nr:thioredoxin [Alistipes sp.]